MDLWQRARIFAEEAASRSQELTMEAVKRSQELTIGGSKFSDIVSETAKKSKEFAAEASKRADQIKVEAFKRADKIKTLADGIGPVTALGFGDLSLSVAATTEDKIKDLERFGVTDDLREFVKGITINTFRDFPMEDDSEMSDIPTVSNIRQDLTEWQERHATLVLTTVKEISKLRYALCPRSMKEKKFWRIYFLLVNSHVSPYEKRYMEDKLKSAEQVKDEKSTESAKVGTVSSSEGKETKLQSKTSISSATDQDLDVFLLGDLGESDENAEDGDEGFDDDFDKMGDSSACKHGALFELGDLKEKNAIC